MKNFLFIMIFFVYPSISFSTYTLNGKYELKSSKINYRVSYLIKNAEGVSILAKGKAECSENCQFLIAAPIKSFESKDSNRDLNMIQVTKASKFPMVVAKFITKNEVTNDQLLSDVEIEFSGVKMYYHNISLHIKATNDGIHGEGKFDLLLNNHKIEKPSLLGVDINDLVPITFEADWKKI